VSRPKIDAFLTRVNRTEKVSRQDAKTPRLT
jgi:hypothetical protein